MKLAPECRDCLLNKVRQQSQLVEKDRSRVEKIVSDCLEVYDCESEKTLAAAVVSGAVHRKNYAELGTEDLYREIKIRDNKTAEEVVKKVSPKLKTIHDWITASVIGNAIDYGVTGHDVAKNFTEFFDQMFEKGLALDDSDKFLKLTKNVVLFTDNCGEAVFDKYLCRALRENGSWVTVVVKDKPMLNDLTLVEAHEINFEDYCDNLYSGGGGMQLGTHPQFFSPEVKKAVEDSTLIIAKGLANYESLTEYNLNKPTAYLMMVKCHAVGRVVGTEKGNLIAVLK
ncbi:MAG: ARMT1-like domain-containing protein [Methanocorpusculum sp.]|nr:ARMT1-like domain-containing protein [Methanocorpusculum sp.]